MEPDLAEGAGRPGAGGVCAPAGTSGRGRPLDHARTRQTVPAGAARGHPRLRILRVGRRRSRPHLRPGHSERPRRQVHRAPPADRTRGRFLALELPDVAAGSQDRRSRRLGLLDHSEGGRRDPGRRHAHRQGISGCRATARRVEPRVRRARRHLRPSDSERHDQPGGLHWLHGGRAAPHRARFGPHDPRAHGARRPCAGHRVRGHRCRVRRGDLGHSQDAQRRSGVHLAHSLLRARRRRRCGEWSTTPWTTAQSS